MSESEKPKSQAGFYFILILGVIFAASTGPIIKLGISIGVNAGNLVFYRQLFSAVACVVFVAARKPMRQEFRTLSRGDIITILLAGLLFGLHLFVWTEALVYTTAVSAVVIAAVMPILTIILQYLFFREKIGYRALLAALIPICGVIGIALMDHSGAGGGSLYGDILVIVSILFVAAYFLCGRRVRRTISLGVYIASVYAISALVLFVLVAATKPFTVFAIDTRAALFAICLGLFGSIIGQNVFAYSLKYVKASTLSMFTLSSPVFASALSFVLNGEVAGWPVYIGGVVILFGIFLFLRFESRDKQVEEEKSYPEHKIRAVQR